jgi:hypothetical protein
MHPIVKIYKNKTVGTKGFANMYGDAADTSELNFVGRVVGVRDKDENSEVFWLPTAKQ